MQYLIVDWILDQRENAIKDVTLGQLTNLNSVDQTKVLHPC